MGDEECTKDIGSIASLNVEVKDSHGDDLTVKSFTWNQEKPRPWDPYEDGEYRIIYCEEPNEVNFMGGLGPNVGHPRSKTYVKRPTTVQNVYNMRTKNRHIYTFCEDPNETHNVPKKKVKVTAADVDIIEKSLRRVKLAENLDTPPSSEDHSLKSVEILDFENPLALDFQGLDHKETIRNDEQILQNRREYVTQNRYVGKCLLSVETEKKFEDNERQKKYSLPEYYNPDAIIDGDESIHQDIPPPVDWKLKFRSPDGPLKFSRPIPEAIPFVPEDPTLGRLIRTRCKKENIDKIAKELKEREERFVGLEQRKKLKKEAEQKKIKREKEIADETFVVDLGEKDFEDYFKDEYAEVLQTYKSLPPVYTEKKYPHTLRETEHLRCTLNNIKRVTKDQALAKAEYLETEPTPAAKINTDNLTCDSESLSEQSTDDDDALSVGHRPGGKFQIRGFHYKLDDEPRGKLDVKHKSKFERPPRGCLTRDEWFNQLAPPKEIGLSFFKKNVSSVPCRHSVNSEKFILHEHQQIVHKVVEISPIKEAIQGKIEGSKQIEQKEPIIKKPKYCQVKKFNLTGYLFGTEKQKKQKSKKITDAPSRRDIEVMQQYEQMRQMKKEAIKRLRHNRMKVLGIPIVQREQSKISSVESESGSSDWIPDKPDDNVAGGNEMKADRLLTQHPRRKQFPERRIDICSKKKDGSTDSRYPYDVPIFKELAKDAILPPNLEMHKTDFTDLFNVRHHHDHHDQTQHKTAYVRYQPKLPKYKLLQSKVAKIRKVSIFDRARLRGSKEELNVDRTIPKVTCETDHDNERARKTTKKKATKPELKLPPVNIISTRTKVKPYPEKQKYLTLLKEKNENFKKLKLKVDEVYEWFIDKDKYLEQMKEEINSINSCNTSLTSSVCTNFTNDSGSYLLVEGTKVPCDFITKPQIPFEEKNRCRIKAKMAESQSEYYGPYYYVPFSGQSQDMRGLTQPKDKFFTSSTRSRFGVRERLKVKVPKFHSEYIGTKEAKYISQLTTEWDEYYINEIKTRPRVRHCKPITMISDARDALRKYFTSLQIQQYVTLSTIARNKEMVYAQEVLRFRDVCNPLFSRWEELHYRSYMRKMQEVKPFYDRTDELKKLLRLSRNKYIKLGMAIMLTEDQWQSRVILQNFHYLLKNPLWREANDWIHRQEDGTQQDYRQAIAVRNTTNVRIRDQDTAWAVKEFYDNVYQKHPVLIVYPNSRQFVAGLLELKMKTFVSLLELHFSMWIQTDLENELNTFNNFVENYISKRTKYVKARCAKKYFIEDRVSELKTITMNLMKKPLLDSISDKLLRKVTALCHCLFEYTIPKNVKDNMKEGAEPSEQFKMVVDLLMDLFEKRDLIPSHIRIKAEQRVKTRRSFIMRQAKRGCALESRINTVLLQMEKNLAPPYKPPRPKGKLPRSRLPLKKKIAEAKLIEMSEMNKLFYKAFTDLDPKDYQYQIGHPDMDITQFLESNCIPFYFDFFLTQHDYYPDYNFKTEIELREGPETGRFLFKDVLEEVISGLELWETRKKMEIEKNIAQTLHLYLEDVQDEDYED